MSSLAVAPLVGGRAQFMVLLFVHFPSQTGEAVTSTSGQQGVACSHLAHTYPGSWTNTFRAA